MQPVAQSDEDVEQTSTADVVDGVTGDDDGGREEGDVELAVFRHRPHKSTSTRVSPSAALHRGLSAGYRRYVTDPLSMFSAEKNKPAEPSTEHSEQNKPSADTEGSLVPVETRPHSSQHPEKSLDEASETLQQFSPDGVAWRDATVQACADLLGRTLSDLENEHNTAAAALAASHTAFPSESRSFEPVPRDLADYAIMTTLKHHDALAMQNATSWLFNLMDRTGAGYVLREEFIRYAPFIGPVADAAVAGMVFDVLVNEQVRCEKEKSTEDQRKTKRHSVPANGDKQKKRHTDFRKGLRRRRPASQQQSGSKSTSAPDGRKDSGSTSPADGNSVIADNATQAVETPERELYPISAALRFDLWRQFFQAIQDKYNCYDSDWPNVKQELGIDPREALIKSQGALDHSDIFPTLGKLYLSQRYLVFFAAVGRNHYVARLGAVAEVSSDAIPIMMRDCIKISLESESQAAIDGVSPLIDGEPEQSGTSERDGVEVDARQEPTLSQLVGKRMKNFTSTRKPLVFSFHEFRETKRRDNWVNLVMEMVAAHKLHVQLGFGSSGRAVPSLNGHGSTLPEVGASNDKMSDDDQPSDYDSDYRNLNYARSPFRNEPSPPLLAVAAHSNIARYRALRRVTFKTVSTSLLIFSHPERNTHIVNWYTDSIRSCDNQNRGTWIERAFAAIRENMNTNKRIYQADDAEPFDVGKLGDAIGRFAELCSPMARVAQLMTNLFQWRNPAATILAILVCVMIATKGLVHYVPAALMFLQAAWVVETKYNWLGLGMGRAETEDAERRQANVLALFAQVHDTLGAAQNALGRLNRELGKVQSLFLWNCEEWQSWVAVGALSFTGFVLLAVPARMLFVFFFFMLFFKHFLPPMNPALEFWQSLPSRLEEGTNKEPGWRRRTTD